MPLFGHKMFKPFSFVRLRGEIGDFIRRFRRFSQIGEGAGCPDPAKMRSGRAASGEAGKSFLALPAPAGKMYSAFELFFSICANLRNLRIKVFLFPLRSFVSLWLVLLLSACGIGATTPTATPKFAYVANQGSANVSAYTINGTTGALTAVTGSPFTAGTGPSSVTTTK